MISASTTKSGSNWLDRLRSSRGFPTGDESGLDRFLSSSSSSGSALSEPSTRPGTSPRETVVEYAGDVSDVLSDLFNMGERSRSYSKPKKGRKQSNPKPFSVKNSSENDNKELCSSDDLRRDKSENGALVSSGDNSLNNNDNTNRNASVRVPVAVVGGGSDEIDLKEYAKSEVTVIDTSFAEWKSEKWVFRKNDEWKIKDKCKPIGKKKKKLDGDEFKWMINEVGDVAKDKVKVKEKKVLHLNKELYSNDKKGERSKELVDFVWKVPQNRFPCPRPPEKSKPEVSPVITLKSIPTSSINGVIKQGRKSSLKKPPKRMKII